MSRKNILLQYLQNFNFNLLRVVFFCLILVVLQSLAFLDIVNEMPDPFLKCTEIVENITWNNLKFTFDEIETLIITTIINFCYSHYLFITTLILNGIITYIFIQNFVEKHLLFFSNVVRIRKINLYIIFIFVLLLLLLLLPRIMIRSFMITSIFGEITYISLILSILWTLPFVSYVLNLLIKLIMKQKIVKSDFYFFNKSVINSINIYIIGYILLFAYISLYHSEFFLNIFLHIWNHMFPSSVMILHYTGISENLAKVFTNEGGEEKMIKVTTEDTVKTITVWSMVKESIDPVFYDSTRWSWINSPYGNSRQWILKNCPVLRAFDFLPIKDPSYDTFRFSFSVRGHAIAGLLGKNENNKKTLFLNAVDENIQTKPETWLSFDISGVSNVKPIVEILKKDYKVDFNSVDMSNLECLRIQSPTLGTKWTNLTSWRTKTVTVQFPNRQHSHLDNLGLKSSSAKFYNAGTLFSNEPDIVWSKMRSLVPIQNHLQALDSKAQELFFSNTELGVGCIYINSNNQGSIAITNEANSKLPFRKTMMDGKYLVRAIVDLNRFTGLDFPTSLNSLHIYTQMISMANSGHLSVITPSFTKFNLISPNHSEPTRIIIPDKYPSSLFAPLGQFVSDNMLWIKLNDVIVQIILTLGKPWVHFALDNEDRGLLGLYYKDDMHFSILDDLYNYQTIINHNPYSKLYQLGHFTAFKMDEGTNTLFILGKSNRPLFEGMDVKEPDRNLILPRYIDSEFKYELSLFINDYGNWLLNKNAPLGQRLHILLWDNFNLEFGISKLWCHNFNNHIYRDLDYFLWSDSKGYATSILHILDFKDRKRFAYYMLSTICPSTRCGNVPLERRFDSYYNQLTY